MLNLALWYFNVLFFVVSYKKLKENLQIIIEDVIKVLVIPIRLISWVVWKIISIKKSSNG